MHHPIYNTINSRNVESAIELCKKSGNNPDNEMDCYKMTPLVMACFFVNFDAKIQKWYELIELLLQKGSNPNHYVANKGTALSVFISRAVDHLPEDFSVGVLNLLLQYGADVKSCPDILLRAISSLNGTHPVIFKKLLQCGACTTFRVHFGAGGHTVLELINKLLKGNYSMIKVKQSLLAAKFMLENGWQQYEAQKAEAERIRLEQQKAEAERIRLEQQKAEAERIGLEQLQKAEAERMRLEQQKAEAEKIRLEQLQKVKAERIRLEQQKAEAERMRMEQLQKAEAERMRMEQQNAERMRLEQQNAEAERIRLEQLQKAEAERMRVEQQKAERIRLEQYNQGKDILNLRNLLEQEKIVNHELTGYLNELMLRTYELSNTVKQLQMRCESYENTCDNTYEKTN